MAKEIEKITTEVVKIKVLKDFKTLLKKDETHEVSPSVAKELERKKVAEIIK